MSLTTLFLDMNSYYASVEQQEQPELRGRPVAVAPVMADSSCCIAASYEAKARGVSTLTGVGEAKRLCPEIAIVPARPALYVETHHRIIDAVDRCLPVAQVCSIDEMYCRLIGVEKEKSRALELGQAIKDSIYTNVGVALKCSVGVAPNTFLAKVGTELDKPDGLIAIERSDLPHILYSLELRDLPGIGVAMHKRLHDRGIHTVEQLCAEHEDRLGTIWESVIGRRWFHWLRGDELREPATHRRTIGHEHVLSPRRRTDEGARAVLVRLLCKAAMRLRHLDYWTRKLNVKVRYLGGEAWEVGARVGCCQDTTTLLEAFVGLWAQRPRDATPFVVGVRLDKLIERRFAPLPMFPEEQRRLRLSETMDTINQKYGRQTLHVGSVHDALNASPLRISFTNVPDLDLQS